MTSNKAANDKQKNERAQNERAARKIFYKIETLVFDAIRQELKTLTEPLIKERLADFEKDPATRHHDSQTVSTPQITPEAEQQSLPKNNQENHQDNHQNPHQAIRALITAFVIETLEKQAPDVIARTLAQAFASPDDTNSKHKS